MAGIVSYGAYVPYWRLDRSAIGDALGTPAGRGTRAVASYDEDATTMGVEAARLALAAAPAGVELKGLVFATASPPYLDKTNATAIHAALGLPRGIPAFDIGGAVRSAMASWGHAMFVPFPILTVQSDMRTGLPGGADEAGGGDAATAFVWAPERTAGDSVIAEHVSAGFATAEFLDRWRVPGEAASHVWEERFGEHVYLPLAEAAFNDALKKIGVTPDGLDHVAVVGVHARAARAFARSCGARPEALADDLTGVIGNPGAAQQGLVLASLLDRAEPGALIAVVSLADGADVVIFRVTDAIVAYRERAASTVAAQVAAGRSGLDYATFLTWRGMLRREPPRRPDPVPPAAPPSFRHEAWKFAFTGSECAACATRYLPPTRVCVNCGALDQMAEHRFADTPATIATFTVDRLAFTPSPPLVAAVVDFDGGGRFRCGLTDVDPDTVAIGDRLKMTFRRISTANGVHNYFWKARPFREGES